MTSHISYLFYIQVELILHDETGQTPIPTAPLAPVAWIKFVLSNCDKKCAFCLYLFSSCGRVCLLIYTYIV